MEGNWGELKQPNTRWDHMIYSNLWLAVEIVLLSLYWNEWTGDKAWAFRLFMGFAIFMQLIAIVHIWLINYRLRQQLRALLEDATDRMVDEIRNSDDDSPYERYLAKMKPEDRRRFEGQKRHAREN